MSMQGFRVRTTSEARFLPETENRPATAYLRLVEDKWIHHEDGTFTQDDPNWYDGKFTGKQAELVQGFPVGAPLIVLGTTREVTTERNGQTYVNVKLSVKTFGKDEAFTKLPEDAQATSQAASANQAATTTQQPAPEDSYATMSDEGWPTAELGSAPEGAEASAPGVGIDSQGEPSGVPTGCWESPVALNLHGYRPPAGDYTIAAASPQAGSPTVIAQVSHTTAPGM
ncbi:hypothetical protein [Aurantimicrobium minutum]|uniref:hypothetical protein n=1 Tax=Aurantimicrobium minutum TaxID=708131 RepID=UPI0024739D90|nr:hypothetical protein [Aurantimicrobium minutum]MDH6422291.1 hypothetical protein [Aurantimicrobium minutum]